MIPRPKAIWTSEQFYHLVFVEILGTFAGKWEYKIFLCDTLTGVIWKVDA